MAIIATTTSNSIKVNPLFLLKNPVDFIVWDGQRRVRPLTRQAVFSTRACNSDGFRWGYFSIAVKRVSINWNAKLHDPKDLTKYGDGKFSKKFGEGGFVIPAPLEVDALMKKVPKDKLTTINELRTALAKKHKTDFTCTITTGIFSWIAAYAAGELAQQGRKRITPYWRTLKSAGQIIPKYPAASRPSAENSKPRATR